VGDKCPKCRLEKLLEVAANIINIITNDTKQKGKKRYSITSESSQIYSNKLLSPPFHIFAFTPLIIYTDRQKKKTTYAGWSQLNLYIIGIYNYTRLSDKLQV